LRVDAAFAAGRSGGCAATAELLDIGLQTRDLASHRGEDFAQAAHLIGGTFGDAQGIVTAAVIDGDVIPDEIDGVLQAVHQVGAEAILTGAQTFLAGFKSIQCGENTFGMVVGHNGLSLSGRRLDISYMAYCRGFQQSVLRDRLGAGPG
jgi:hypothetical protein